MNFGFEVQIDEQARPDGSPLHRTGAIYTFQAPNRRGAARAAGGGVERIRDHGRWSDYTVSLNGAVVNQFHFSGDPQSPTRGQGSFIGLQAHTGRVRFRNLQIKAL